MSSDTGFSRSDASTGDGYPARGYSLPPDLSLPDRRACLVAAANAAASWVRARRATWDEMPVQVRSTATAYRPVPAPALALDSAAAEALISALTLDGAAAETLAPVLDTAEPQVLTPAPALVDSPSEILAPAFDSSGMEAEWPARASRLDETAPESLAPAFALDSTPEALAPADAPNGNALEVLTVALAPATTTAETVTSVLVPDGPVSEGLASAPVPDNHEADTFAPAPALNSETFTPDIATVATFTPEPAPNSYASEVFAPEPAADREEADTFAPVLDRQAADMLARDTATTESFAPVLAVDGAASEALALRALTTDDYAPVIESEPEFVAPQESVAAWAPDAGTLFERASSSPSAGSAALDTAAQSARALAGTILRWWPQVAMVAVVLVIGVTARVYWPTLTASKPGVAVLESVPDGSQVIVDGKEIGTTPLTATLSAGPHSVEFRFKAATRTVQVDMQSGGRIAERVDWTRKPSGSLQVDTDPPGAKVSVDGALRGVTPMMLEDLSVGRHTLVLERANASIQRTVTINATETTHVNETIFPGWITVFSPFPLAITEGSRSIRLDDRNQVMLPSGSHELRFENRALGYEETRRVEVRSGSVTSLSVVPPQSSLTVTASAPAEVWLDGVSAGQTPLTARPVDLGTREVVVRTAGGDERRFPVTVTTKPVTLDVDFSKPRP